MSADDLVQAIPAELRDVLVPLEQIPPIVEREFHGKRVHCASVRRWTSKGAAGVRLQVVQIAGTTCTTRRRLAVFFQECADARREPKPAPAKKASRRARR